MGENKSFGSGPDSLHRRDIDDIERKCAAGETEAAWVALVKLNLLGESISTAGTPFEQFEAWQQIVEAVESNDIHAAKRVDVDYVLAMMRDCSDRFVAEPTGQDGLAA